MKRWAILTVFLYALALILLTVPVVSLAFGGWGKQSSMSVHEVLGFFTVWPYWVWLGVLVAGQVLLLLLPIHITERRLPARRPLKVPVIVTAFFLGNLCFAAVTSLLAALFKENGIVREGGLTLIDSMNPFPAGPNNSGWHGFWAVVITISLFWLIWGLVFRHYARADDDAALLKRLTRWLLRGSILELIIAVPSHVIVRRRDDCCAPVGTFWGIATGISVMLLCFGPGVYFLFVKRMSQLQPKPKADAEASGT